MSNEDLIWYDLILLFALFQPFFGLNLDGRADVSAGEFMIYQCFILLYINLIQVNQ